MRQLLALLATLLLVGCSSSSTEDISKFPNERSSSELSITGFYSVDEYDVSRDSAADLAATVKLSENKRILLTVGGDW